MRTRFAWMGCAPVLLLIAPLLAAHDDEGARSARGRDLEPTVGTPRLASRAEPALAPDSAAGDSRQGLSPGPTVSDDGRYIVFASSAPDLVPGDENQKRDVFRYDRLTGELLLLSVNASGSGTANGDSRDPVVSADGARVAFRSRASDLALADTDLRDDIFVRDVDAETTILVSVNLDGTGSGNRASNRARISANGQVVAFESDADDLVANDRDIGFSGSRDVFARDLAAGVTHLASASSAGDDSGNRNSSNPVISADGQVVAFESNATDLVANDGNSRTDVFAYDLATREVQLVSVNHDGTASSTSISEEPAISANGLVVAFRSSAGASITPLQTYADDIYVRNLLTRVTTLVTVDEDGSGGGFRDSRRASLSADGRVVAFESAAWNLESVKVASANDVFVRDLDRGVTILVSVDATGTREGNADSFGPRISADGTRIAFYGPASDLEEVDQDSGLNDANEYDVFVRDLQAGTTRLLSINFDGTDSGDGDSRGVDLSGDGTVAVFDSRSSDLVAGLNIQPQFDVFARGLSDDLLELVSRRDQSFPDSVTPRHSNQGGFNFRNTSMSENGRYIVFESDAPDIVPGDENGVVDVFRFDRRTGMVELVSANLEGTGTGNGRSQNPVLSANGRIVAFQSNASDLAALDTDTGTDIYARDMITGKLSLLTVNADGTGTGFGTDPVISANGRMVAFVSLSGNLVPLANPPPNGLFEHYQVFVRDLRRKETLLISVDPGGTTGGNAGSGFVPVLPDTNIFFDRPPVFSADGFKIAFESKATNLHPLGSSELIAKLFVRDLRREITELASVSEDGTEEANSSIFEADMDARGNVVVFASQASNLSAADIDACGIDPPPASCFVDVFLRDLRTGVTELISVDRHGTGSGNFFSDRPRISADGNVVLFHSAANNLVDNDSGAQGGENPINGEDLYIRDRTSGETELVTESHDQTGSANSFLGRSYLSADGCVVAFSTAAGNLVPGVGHVLGADVYVRVRPLATTFHVSVSLDDGGEGNESSTARGISADGRVIAFDSRAGNLVPLDLNGTWDVFVNTWRHERGWRNRNEVFSGNAFRSLGKHCRHELRVSDD